MGIEDMLFQRLGEDCDIVELCKIKLQFRRSKYDVCGPLKSLRRILQSKRNMVTKI